MRAALSLSLAFSLAAAIPAQAQSFLQSELFAPPAAPASERVQVIEGIAAVVNDGVVLNSELAKSMNNVVRDFRKQGKKLPPGDALRRQVLDKLILNEVQMQMARETGVVVTDDTVTRSLTKIASRNRMTLSQLRDYLAREGQSFAAFRHDIHQQLVLRKLRQRQVNNRITITDEELEQYLAKAENQDRSSEFLVSHILVAIPAAASPERLAKATKQANDLVARARNGENFAELAAVHSNAPDALKGGDLGWRKMERIPSIFTNRVSRMNKGEVSDAFRSPSGLHIIKMMDLRNADQYIVTQTKARHILVKTNEVVSDLDAKTKLERIRDRIVNGEDFAALATGNSDDTASAIAGGDLGWVNPGQMVPEFQTVMDGLSDGQVSPPFHSPFGWHIVQVLSRRQEDKSDTVRRNQAREALIKRRVEEETELWLRRIRDEAFIEIKTG